MNSEGNGPLRRAFHMTSEDPVERFVGHSRNFWELIKVRKSKAANAETDAGNSIVENWKIEGSAENILVSLLNHNSDSVRFAAASHLLNLSNNTDAVAVLRRLVKNPNGMISPAARLTLVRKGFSPE